MVVSPHRRPSSAKPPTPAPAAAVASAPASAPASVATEGEAEAIGLFLLPRFSLGAFTACIEPLRLANRESGASLYDWNCFSLDGLPVQCSAGVSVAVEGNLEEAARRETLLLVGGTDVDLIDDDALCRALRRMDRRGCTLGSLCTGSWILARAGVLNGHEATIHWENLDALTESFPAISVSERLFTIGERRMTCAGFAAATDLMLALIARTHGNTLALQVAEQLNHDRIRTCMDSQRPTVSQRLGSRHPKLLKVVRRMEDNLESPLSREGLVEGLGVSTRQMERLFDRYLHQAPARYYLNLRLARARLLLLYTQMSVLEVGLACGFVSASHFSRCYRKRFAHTPREERGLRAIPDEDSLQTSAQVEGVRTTLGAGAPPC